MARQSQEDRLTPELARRHFGYDQETGAMWWKEPRSSRVKVGDKAGSINGQGFVKVKFSGYYYSVHRVAWMMMVNRDVPQLIEHINGCRSDNRISNLRASSSQENAQHRRKPHRDTKLSKFIGATLQKSSGRFVARIRTSGEPQRYLGMFDTAEQAHAAYLAAKRQAHVACTI